MHAFQSLITMFVTSLVRDRIPAIRVWAAAMIAGINIPRESIERRGWDGISAAALKRELVARASLAKDLAEELKYWLDEVYWFNATYDMVYYEPGGYYSWYKRSELYSSKLEQALLDSIRIGDRTRFDEVIDCFLDEEEAIDLPYYEEDMNED